MAKYDDDVFDKLMDIVRRHWKAIDDYDSVIAECPTKLMSIGIDIYGMFYPDQEIAKYIDYKGKLTNNEKRRHYTYFFDERGRLRLTERYVEKGKLCDLIFYYYYEDYVEIVWYSMIRRIVEQTGYLEYADGKLARFVESFDLGLNIKYNRKIDTYHEYIFNTDDEFIRHRSYSELYGFNGIPDERISKMRKR